LAKFKNPPPPTLLSNTYEIEPKGGLPMGKSKKKDKKKTKIKPTNYKTPSQTVDERAKQAMSLQPPPENPFKMDNEKLIDSYMRFNRRKPDKVNPKLASRLHR
jgi:hypothetical protein